MQTLKSFIDQSLLIWQDSTGAARIGIFLLLLICVGAIVGVGIWSVQPNYVVFRDQLDGQQLSDLESALSSAGIKMQLGRSTVYVDSRKLAAAEVAAGSLGGETTASGFKPQKSDFWADPRSQKELERYNRQQEIALAIRNFRSVKNAEVILSIPNPGPFIRASHQPSASVALTLIPNTDFDESQAATIASFVASAVPGLDANAVTVSNQETGATYSTDSSHANLSNQDEHRVGQERMLAQKAESMLFRTLGVGNAIVKINTSFTYPNKTIHDVKVDKDNSFATKEIVNSKTTKRHDSVSGGAAGTTSNNVNQPSRATSGLIEEKKEDLINEIVAGKTETDEIIRTPELKYMTVSVLVNSKALVDESNVTPTERSDKYQKVVKNAIGFDQKRGDQISIEFLEFADPLPLGDGIAAPFPWEQVHLILKNISLGLAGLIALLLGVMAIRKLTPISAGQNDKQPVKRDSQVGQLSDLVKNNPEVFSQIISAWSSGEPAKDDAKKPAAKTSGRQAA